MTSSSGSKYAGVGFVSKEIFSDSDDMMILFTLKTGILPTEIINQNDKRKTYYIGKSI